MDLRPAEGRYGRDVVRALRKRRPGMPVVVVTGFDSRAPQADLRGLGGPTARLRKPFDCDELVDRLAGLLDGTAAPVPPRRRASDILPVAA